MFNKSLAKITLIPKKIAIALIALYRHTISPFLGQNCRFHPSCSQYAHEAIQRFGLVHGGWLALKRLLCCHPLHPGGIDNVPNKKLPENNHGY